MRVETVIVWTACGLFAASAVYDLRSRRIPNAIPLALAGLFAGYALLGGAGPARDLGMSLAIGAVLLLVGFILYLSGRFGAGDAKLMAIAGMWAGPGELSFFLFGLGGCAFALSLFALLPFERARRLRTNLPFAVAIAPPAAAIMMARACPPGLPI